MINFFDCVLYCTVYIIVLLFKNFGTGEHKDLLKIPRKFQVQVLKQAEYERDVLRWFSPEYARTLFNRPYRSYTSMK